MHCHAANQFFYTRAASKTAPRSTLVAVTHRANQPEVCCTGLIYNGAVGAFYVSVWYSWNLMLMSTLRRMPSQPVQSLSAPAERHPLSCIHKLLLALGHAL